MARGSAWFWTVTCVWLCCCILQCCPANSLWDSSLNGIRDWYPPREAEEPVYTSPTTEGEVCSSIDIRNSVAQFKKLENCSVVEGSVQILLQDKTQKKDFENLTFPKLREITGYLLLYRVQGLHSLSILFPNLAVIRGDILFHNYALVIYELLAIQDIGLINLTTILRGSVRFEKNPHLCYVDTIDWDIIAEAGRNGHFIKSNKPNSQCPKTCLADCPLSMKFPGQKLCWNSHTCQKVCSDVCKSLNNSTCSSSSDNECCHKECLGGCNGTTINDCIACRHVVYQDKCQQHCPPGTYKYLNRRCINEDECKRINNRLSMTPMNHEVFWKPFKGECLPQCPPGYSVNDSNKHQCIKCEGLCPKICDGAVIDSVGSAQKLKGCTFVNGSLEIQIQGGDNIIKELDASLNLIQEIRGYLKIARSYPLISLNFLRDLRHIRGEQLDKKEYALLVLDNQNLQELWNWETRKTKLQISGGKVFFHFNSKLCVSKIYELRNYSSVKDWDERDVSPSSNGDRVACDVVHMEVIVWGIKSAVVGLKWKSFRKYRTDVDYRSLLGYVVYYRETQSKNVTIYDGRDACGADDWKVDDVEADEEAEFVITLLTHLKPATTYAAYMRTYTIASALVGAQSEILYFTTHPDTPSPPVNVIARAESHDEIVIQWSAPKKPNGNITHYVIDGIREKDSVEFISQRNYCNEPLTSLSEIKKSTQDKVKDIQISAEKKTKSSSSDDCCPCNKLKTLPEDDDAQFQIKFEDFLQNNVFIKNPNPVKNPHTENITDLIQPTSPPHMSNSTVYYLNESLTRVPSTMSSTFVDVNDTLPTEMPTTITPELEGHHFHYEVHDAFFLVVKNLHHFTEYTIEVKACQDASTTENEPCSPQAITTIRTRPLGGADDIDLNSIKILQENLTYGSLNVKWEEPKNYNGLIVNYYIEIKSSDFKAFQFCVTQSEFQKNMGYTMFDLMPGNYSLKLRATSLAGSGNWTTPIYFTIPNLKGGLKPEIVALLVIVVVFIVSVAFGIPLYVYYKKKYGNDMPTMLYASVNPEYMSAVYEPDEWEVPREKIALKQELGQGSFGMVYKGEYTTDDQRVLKCAVKTVNETASLRERIEFLQEASVMKAFNCHHVVKLLGVVSKGHPTLVVMELMGKGDLKAYLRSRRPDNEENIDNPNAYPPTLKEILQMAVEIADGMAYLAAKKFVHRDLAARNCMVSDDLTVKIGDFGMTRDIYETDYYRKGGKGLLPVRWMAPECLKDGLFSSQSDIWSYGIVLWEMATLASQPYQGLSNEQVLQYVISGGKMTKPENCPEKLYAIMDLCWDKNPKARPTFIELIDMLLPDINQAKFREVSFYFTQRQETCTKETELCESATASTPMRTQWMESQNSREESDCESEVTFFPPTRKSYTSVNYHDQGAKAVHSNDNSKGMSVTSSDDSKGSKISSASNGSIANGHVTFAPGRTTMC